MNGARIAIFDTASRKRSQSGPSLLRGHKQETTPRRSTSAARYPGIPRPIPTRSGPLRKLAWVFGFCSD